MRGGASLTAGGRRDLLDRASSIRCVGRFVANCLTRGQGRRRPTFTAVATCLLIVFGVAGSAAADPRSFGSLDFNDSLEPSAGYGGANYETGYPDSHSPTEGDLARFEDAVIPGATRTPWRVLKVPARDGLRAYLFAPSWWSDSPRTPSWTLAMLVKLASVDGPYQLMSVGAGPFVVEVHEGRLRYEGAVIGANTLSAGTWHQIVVVREDSSGAIRAYVDGALDATLADPAGAAVYDHGQPDQYERLMFKLLHYRTPWEGPAAGSDAWLARVRGWRSALSPETIAALEQLDTTPPRIGVWTPPEEANAGLRPRFYGNVLNDDSADKSNILTEIILTDPSGRVGAVYPRSTAEMYGPQMDWIRDWPGGPSLTRGVRYKATIKVVDGAGNTTTHVRYFIADDPPPAMVIHEPGPETADPTPRLAGWTERWEGDMPVVHASLLVPEGMGWRAVSSVALDLDRGGNFAGDFVEPVPPGDYTLRVTHVDEGARTAIVEQPLRVIAPLAPVAEHPAETLPPSTTNATDDAAAVAVGTVVKRVLRRWRLRRLLRHRVRVPLSVSGPGTASVRVYLRRPRAATAARRQLLVKGRLVKRRAGRGTLRLVATKRARRIARSARRRVPVLVRARFAPLGSTPSTTNVRLTLRR